MTDWLIVAAIVGVAVAFLVRKLRREQGCAHCPAHAGATAGCQHGRASRTVAELKLGSKPSALKG